LVRTKIPCFSSFLTSWVLFILWPCISLAGDYAAVTGPCDFVFPRDHGSHDLYQTEWWYYTGNLESPAKKRYGFQLTFFRVRMVPPAHEKTWPEDRSAWRTPHLFLAHAALSDLDGKGFFHDEKMARVALGLAGVGEEGQSVHVFMDTWSALIGEGSHRLSAATNRFTLDLTCKPLKPPVSHGLQGYSLKGRDPASASCYYSFTRLETSGTLTVGGEKVEVSGTAWMDHEFSSAPLEGDITGWDWFSIQLDDHTELMLYLLRLEKGGFSPASSGTFVNPSGQARHLSREDFTVDVLGRWKSPLSGASYPSRWRIAVKPLQIELFIVPNLADQELITQRTTRVTYWEGSVSISGRSGITPVKGVGYVEMTGYAAPFTLTPSP
jgi:predicted secreted hydrolase